MTATRETPETDADAILARLRRLGDPIRATQSQRFFKTGPGEYGEGDRFLGLTVPVVRELTRRHEALPLDQIERLLDAEWHEARLLALLILVRRFESRRATETEREAIYHLYLRRLDRVNNWDLVDTSAPQIVGGWLATRSRAPLRRLARSSVMWERRVAMLATFHDIRQGDPAEALIIARVLRDDPHDLIHKAVGWMLREIGQRVDTRVLRDFLDEHAPRLPRTMLRYAIERLPEATRRHYLTLPREAPTTKPRRAKTPSRPRARAAR